MERGTYLRIVSLFHDTIGLVDHQEPELGHILEGHIVGVFEHLTETTRRRDHDMHRLALARQLSALLLLGHSSDDAHDLDADLGALGLVRGLGACFPLLLLLQRLLGFLRQLFLSHDHGLHHPISSCGLRGVGFRFCPLRIGLVFLAELLHLGADLPDHGGDLQGQLSGGSHNQRMRDAQIAAGLPVVQQ